MKVNSLAIKEGWIEKLANAGINPVIAEELYKRGEFDLQSIVKYLPLIAGGVGALGGGLFSRSGFGALGGGLGMGLLGYLLQNYLNKGQTQQPPTTPTPSSTSPPISGSNKTNIYQNEQVATQKSSPEAERLRLQNLQDKHESVTKENPIIGSPQGTGGGRVMETVPLPGGGRVPGSTPTKTWWGFEGHNPWAKK